MCFSAGASFTASAVISVVGITALRHTTNSKMLPLALVPLFFAFQQFIEGLLWLSLNGTGAHAPFLTYIFLFFAFLWWPIYVPLLASSLEPDKKRRIILYGLLVLGLLVGLYLFAGFMLNPLPASIVNNSIYYTSSAPYSTLITYFYVLITVGAGLVSSQKIMHVFSILLGSSALIAWYFFTTHFTSVWCFFAAFISVVLVLYIREHHFENVPVKIHSLR